MAVLMIILPLILGALIGYVTNYIAIKMLFRPYTEKRIFGIHVPFTPGVIPKEREKLAVGIANLVAKELVTEDAFYSHIRDEKFRESLKAKVSEVLTDFLSGNKSISLSKELIYKIEELTKIMSVAFLSSPYILKPVSSVVSFLLGELDKIKIQNILDNEHGLPIEKLEIILLDSIRSKKNNNFEKLRDFLIHVFEKSLEKDMLLSEVIGKDSLVFLEGSLHKIYTPITQIIMELLKKKAVRDVISEQIYLLINQNKSKFGMFQSLLLSFVNTKSNMDSIVDMLAISIQNILSKKETEDNTIKATIDFVEAMSQKKISDLQKEYKINVPSIIDSLTHVLSNYTKSHDFEKNVKFYLMSLKRNYKDTTVLQIISDIFALDSKELSIKMRVVIENYLEKPQNIEYIGDIMKAFIVNLFEGEKIILNLPPEKRDRLDTVASDIIYEFLNMQIPNIVKSMQIYDIVYKKINSLDVKDVEKLILIIMQNQLGWINIFGAILGALMGGIQLIVLFVENYLAK